jgi:Subtilase family
MKHLLSITRLHASLVICALCFGAGSALALTPTATMTAMPLPLPLPLAQQQALPIVIAPRATSAAVPTGVVMITPTRPAASAATSSATQQASQAPSGGLPAASALAVGAAIPTSGVTAPATPTPVTPKPAASSPLTSSPVEPNPALPIITLDAPTPTAPPTPSAPTAPNVPAATFGTAPTFTPPAFNPVAADKSAEVPAFEPGQLLVLWINPDAATSGLSTLIDRYQLRPRQRYSLSNLGLTVVLLTLPTDREARALRERLRAEQPDWIVDLNARSLPIQASASSASQARLYAHKMLGITLHTNAAGSHSAPSSLRMGVIDTGLDSAWLSPEALNGSVVTIRSVLSPADKAADTAHGTAVLQLIASAPQTNGFAGAAPAMQLAWTSAMREVNGKASTNSLYLALALDWLVAQQVSLVNMSLGGQGDAVLQAVVARVLAKNIAIVAAGGNNPSRSASPVYPAAYAGVWAVTAVDAGGKLYAQAQRADYTTLAAPGAELWIPSKSPDAAQTGSYVSGTSYASALASAALAWQPTSFWSLSLSQKRTVLCQQSIKPQGDAWMGCGLVQKVVAHVLQ